MDRQIYAKDDLPAFATIRKYRKSIHIQDCSINSTYLEGLQPSNTRTSCTGRKTCVCFFI